MNLGGLYDFEDVISELIITFALLKKGYFIMTRWIFVVLGFAFFRFPGAFIGYLIGSLIENTNFFASTSRQSGKASGPSQRVSPAEFELKLLSLASLVIKADGKVSKTELDYVRMYFVKAYGKERANATFRMFNEVVKQTQFSAFSLSIYLRDRTRYEARLQLLHFLFSIANADGHISDAERSIITEISAYLGIESGDYASIRAMFIQNRDSAYQILEVDRNASQAEIKAAYRTMVKKYHPDKLQHLDEAHRKGGEEKFKKVQEAYEQIQKERGF